MPPVLTNSGAYATTRSGNLAVAYPATVAANDILVVCLSANDNVVSTMPAGWALKQGTNNTSGLRTEVWWLRATGSESGTVTVTRTSGNAAEARMHAYSGTIGSGDPFDAITASANASSTTVTASSLTTTVDDAYVAFLASAAGATSVSGYSGTNPTFSEQDDNSWDPRIQYVDAIAANNAGGGTSLSFTMPTVQTGDVVLVSMFLRSTTATASRTDWAQQGSGVSDGSTGIMRTFWYAVPAVGGDQSGSTVTFTTSNVKSSGVLIVLRGASTSSPIQQYITNTVTSANTVITPSNVTPGQANTFVLTFAHKAADTTGYSVASGYQLRASGGATSGGSAATRSGSVVATRDAQYPTSGAAASAVAHTLSGTTARLVAAHVAIAAANASATPVTQALADGSRTTAGTTGSRTATLGTAGVNTGVLFALKPQATLTKAVTVGLVTRTTSTKQVTAGLVARTTGTKSVTISFGCSRNAAYFADTFSSALDTTTKFEAFAAGEIVQASGGRLQLGLNGVDFGYVALYPRTWVDLSTSPLWIELLPGTQPAGTHTKFTVFTASNIGTGVGTPVSFERQGGGDFIVSAPFGFGNEFTYSATYDSAAHRWLRVRHDSGTLYAETSANGSSWTERGHVTVTAEQVSGVYFELLCEDLAGVSSSFMAEFDNLNVATSTKTTTVSLSTRKTETKSVTAGLATVLPATTVTKSVTGSLTKAKKLEDLVDRFDSALDTAKWSTSVTGSATNTVTGGVLRLERGTTSGNATFTRTATATNFYSLRGSSLQLEIPYLDVGTNNRVFISIRFASPDAQAWNLRFNGGAGSGTVDFNNVAAGGGTTVLGTGWTAGAQTTWRWVRFTHDAVNDQLQVYRSADALTWTLMHTATSVTGNELVGVRFAIVENSANSNNVILEVDNVNVIRRTTTVTAQLVARKTVTTTVQAGMQTAASGSTKTTTARLTAQATLTKSVTAGWLMSERKTKAATATLTAQATVTKQVTGRCTTQATVSKQVTGRFATYARLTATTTALLTTQDTETKLVQAGLWRVLVGMKSVTVGLVTRTTVAKQVSGGWLSVLRVPKQVTAGMTTWTTVAKLTTVSLWSSGAGVHLVTARLTTWATVSRPVTVGLVASERLTRSVTVGWRSYQLASRTLTACLTTRATLTRQSTAGLATKATLAKQVTVRIAVLQADNVRQTSILATLQGRGTRLTTAGLVMRQTLTRAVTASCVTQTTGTRQVTAGAALQRTVPVTTTVKFAAQGTATRAVTTTLTARRTLLKQTTVGGTLLRQGATRLVSVQVAPRGTVTTNVTAGLWTTAQTSKSVAVQLTTRGTVLQNVGVNFLAARTYTKAVTARLVSRQTLTLAVTARWWTVLQPTRLVTALATLQAAVSKQTTVRFTARRTELKVTQAGLTTRRTLTPTVTVGLVVQRQAVSRLATVRLTTRATRPLPLEAVVTTKIEGLTLATTVALDTALASTKAVGVGLVTQQTLVKTFFTGLTVLRQGIARAVEAGLALWDYTPEEWDVTVRLDAFDSVTAQIDPEASVTARIDPDASVVARIDHEASVAARIEIDVAVTGLLDRTQ